MNGTSRSIQYGMPIEKSAKARAAKGRVCSDPGCKTVLSTYNAAPTCSIHSQPSFKVVSEQQAPRTGRR